MKSWFQSKTVWVNVLVAIVSVGTALANTDLIAAYPGVVAGIGTVIGVVNVLLRFVTEDSIK